MAHKWRMVFTLFKDWKKNLRLIFHNTRKLYKIHMLVSTNRVCIHTWSEAAFTLSQVDAVGTAWSAKPRTSTVWPFPKERLPTPCHKRKSWTACIGSSTSVFHFTHMNIKALKARSPLKPRSPRLYEHLFALSPSSAKWRLCLLKQYHWNLTVYLLRSPCPQS